MVITIKKGNTLENIKARGRGILIKCPVCGELGRLYYNDRIKWYVKHGSRRTHYVSSNVAVEIAERDERLALIHYMGGDYFILSKLLKMIPPHRVYVEVFGGGATLLLNKPPTRVEVYNDLDNNLTNLFRVVRDRLDEFLKKCEWLLYSRSTFYEYLKNIDAARDDVERAVMYYYVIRSSLFGLFGGSFAVSRFKNQALEFFNALDDLKKIHERLKNVTIENLDFRDVIRRYDSDKTFFYCDPPHLYLGTEARDYYVVKFSNNDFMELLRLLENIKGKFLLKNVFIPFLVEWADEHGYTKTVVEVPRFSGTARNGTRGAVKYLLISSYGVKQ